LSGPYVFRAWPHDWSPAADILGLSIVQAKRASKKLSEASLILGGGYCGCEIIDPWNRPLAAGKRERPPCL